MTKRRQQTTVVRPGTRRGYDAWAESYDERANPLVALDRRHALRHLAPRPGERILDAGCGTGGHLRALLDAGARPIGIDFSHGMLRQARRKEEQAPLAAVDLSLPLPLCSGSFDAILCSLVSEHLEDLNPLFDEMHAVLKPGGRLVFSAFHPEMAAAGVEANFEHGGVEYRLGAARHTVDDYVDAACAAGFHDLRYREYRVDDRFVAQMPTAAKYHNRPLLLVLDGTRRHDT